MARRPAVKRPTRVAELLREFLATLLLTKVADPRLRDLTITEVEMTPDLKQARIYYLVREGAVPAEVMHGLDKALGFIRSEVGKAHILRTMPEFHFLPDDSLDKAARVEALFRALGEKGQE